MGHPTCPASATAHGSIHRDDAALSRDDWCWPACESAILSGVRFHPGWAAAHAARIDASLFSTPTRQAIFQELREARNGESFNEALFLDRLTHRDLPFTDVKHELLEVEGFRGFSKRLLTECLAKVRQRADTTLCRSCLQAAADAEHVRSMLELAREALATFDPLLIDPLGASLPTLADTLRADFAPEVAEAMPTGICWFDRAMPGGALHRGDKLAVAGPPGCGKTAWALQLTLGMLSANPHASAVWALGEMSMMQLRNRALQCHSGLMLETLQRPWLELSPLQTQRKREAIDTLRTIGSRFHFVPAPLTPEAIEDAITATSAGWAVIDYLQLCRGSDGGSRHRRDEIDAVLRELVRVAQVHGVVLFIISDMPKAAGHTRGRNIFDAFKETGEIAYAADLAYVGEILTDQDYDAEPPEEVEVRWRCLKARNGSPTSIITRFRRAVQSFEGYTGRANPAPDDD